MAFNPLDYLKNLVPENTNIFGASPNPNIKKMYDMGLLGKDKYEDVLNKTNRQSVFQGLLNTGLSYASQPKNQNLGSILPYLAKAGLAGVQAAQSPYDQMSKDAMMNQQLKEVAFQQSERDRELQKRSNLEDILSGYGKNKIPEYTTLPSGEVAPRPVFDVAKQAALKGDNKETIRKLIKGNFLSEAANMISIDEALKDKANVKYFDKIGLVDMDKYNETRNLNESIVYQPPVKFTKPDTFSIDKGDQKITYQFDSITGTANQIATAPRWQPKDSSEQSLFKPLSKQETEQAIKVIEETKYNDIAGNSTIQTIVTRMSERDNVPPIQALEKLESIGVIIPSTTKWTGSPTYKVNLDALSLVSSNQQLQTNETKQDVVQPRLQQEGRTGLSGINKQRKLEVFDIPLSNPNKNKRQVR
jgi:hypothetical protein